nr:carboxypeptidase-like regulatory domain-containing protein [Spirosomataceae bacterium]
GGTSLIKTEKLEMENEMAVNQANGKVDFGAFSNVIYNGERFRGSNNLVYAGKHYYGFYNNGWLLNNALYYNVLPKLTAAIINNYNRLNPSLDLLVLNASPYYKNNTAELTYRANRRSRIVLNVTHQYKEDRQQTKKFHFKENYARLMYFYQTDSYNLWLDGQYGYTHNLLVSPDKAERRFSSRYMFQNEFKITQSFSMGGNAEYLNTAKYSTTNEPSQYFFYGGTVKYRIRKVLDFNLTYRNNFAPDELIERRNFFDLQSTLRLGQHQLSLIGTQTYIPGFLAQNNLILSLRYRYLLNIPVAKYKNLGSIKGQITGSSNVKKSGVLVQLGNERYLTDANGGFVINNILPNKYTLNLLRSSIGMGTVPTVQVPMEVTIKPDSALKIEIPFAKSGAIAGKIVVEKSTQIGAKETTQTKPEIMLKLHNGRESFLTLPDENGQFSFKEILPGEWQLSATLLGKDGKFTIVQPKKVLTVVAEQSQQVTFTVKPIERNIRFSDKPILISSK